MAYRLASPNIQFLSAGGQPLAGGLLYFYATGTTTPVNTYQDSALTIPNANPIVLNSAGYAGSIFLLPTQQYKVVLTDANNVQQWTEDPVSDPTSGSATVASSLSITDASGAPKSLFLETASEPRWGLVSDGTPETGSNAGSNFTFNRYDDSGSLLGSVFTVNRATGAVNFTNVPTFGNSPLIPSGTIWSFGMNAAPTGWLICNGAAVSRATYASLFTAIGTVWGAGDGSTTFNVPNALGYFLRGFDSSGSIDPGRTFGSTQADEFQTHVHGWGNNSQAGGLSAGNTGSFIQGGSPNGLSTTQPLTGNAGAETRPKNIAVLFCIKT